MNTKIAIPEDITVANLAHVFSVYREDLGIRGHFKVLQSPPAGPWKVDILNFGQWKNMSLTPSQDGRTLHVSFSALRPQVGWMFGSDIIAQASKAVFAAVGVVAMIGSAIQGQFITSVFFALFVAAMYGLYRWDRKDEKKLTDDDITEITNTIFELSRKLHSPVVPVQPVPSNLPTTGISQG